MKCKLIDGISKKNTKYDRLIKKNYKRMVKDVRKYIKGLGNERY